MSRRPAPTSSPSPPREPALEQQILEVELRMLQRRRLLLSSWNEVEHTVGQVLAPRAWLWPLALGAVGGCLLGLLWRRGDRRAEGGPAESAAAAHESGLPRGTRWAALLGLLAPWLKPQLTSLVHQWLRPAVLEAAESLVHALLAGVLKRPASHPPRPHPGPQQAPAEAGAGRPVAAKPAD